MIIGNELTTNFQLTSILKSNPKKAKKLTKTEIGNRINRKYSKISNTS